LDGVLGHFDYYVRHRIVALRGALRARGSDANAAGWGGEP